MNPIGIEKIYIILFSLIPASIVVGPSVSLINISLISLIFLFFSIFNKNFEFLKNPIFLILILIYIYLIFNTFISLDAKMGISRNFGFIRFITIFLAINYFIYLSKNIENVYKIWLLIISIVVIDSYIEFFIGKNILGYGGEDGAYQNRIVSFFKDEPVVGAYLNGFLFILIGYIFDKFFKKKLKFKIILLLICLILICCVIITGERSNSIKLIFGILLFIYLNQNLKLKPKLLVTCFAILFASVVIFNSNYLKIRYGQQLFSHLFDDQKRSKFIENNLYLKLYKSGIAVFKDYPLFGVGNKNYRVATAQNVIDKKNDEYFVSTHPHQIYFELLAEHGLVGTLILLVLLFFLMFKNLKIIILSRNSIQLGCLIYLIINFLPILPSGSFFNDFNSTLFWVNLSLMYACNTETNIFNKSKKYL